MKRALLIACLALLLISPAQAMRVIILGGGPSGGGPDVWYYDEVGATTDPYTSNYWDNQWGPDEVCGQRVKVLQTGTITKIGVKVYSKGGTSGGIKLWLGTGTDPNWTKHECQEIPYASITTGWNDVTLSSGKSVSADEIVFVAANSDAPGGDGHGIWYDGTSGGHFESSQSYGAWCDASSISRSDEWEYAVRVYVD